MIQQRQDGSRHRAADVLDVHIDTVQIGCFQERHAGRRLIGRVEPGLSGRDRFFQQSNKGE
ncbi:hypothetical protein [Paenibacillus mucilaginosus]|uniref:hypothetical protein n=1 Tax=Paenibacillus mucilaginosus TaxID=61624 RepID=UPI0005A2AD8D|nr:hypothetical protein [Paenibacillus mucilaginosus]MCG7213568.1 hypothetical protein [Paenibacillus mucilaginosus]WDM27617.1 hypothetical protein KCX80_35660 [Paenibacillus mucilaginosus]